MLLGDKTRGINGSCEATSNFGNISDLPWEEERSVSIAEGFFKPAGDFAKEFKPQSEPTVFQLFAVYDPRVSLQFSVRGLDQQPFILLSGVPHKHTCSQRTDVLRG
jgi:hypothetical protein